MTVGELIEKLREYPEHYPVRVEGYRGFRVHRSYDVSTADVTIVRIEIAP